MTQKLLLVDAPYLCYRAKFATGQLSYREVPTGVIYTFLRDINTFEELFPDFTYVFCFDSHKSHRKEQFAEYKRARAERIEQASREEMLEIQAFRHQVAQLKKKELPRLGFKNVFQVTGFEADDIIAKLCKKYPHAEKVIVSADQDLFQCLSKNCSMWSPKAQQMTTYNSFRDKYGVKPSQWVEVKATAGCSTDNVPGIRGVGEKTAIKYLLGTLNKRTKAYKAILEGQEIIKRNFPLVTLPYPMKHFDLPKIEDNQLNVYEWNTLCSELGMRSLARPA